MDGDTVVAHGAIEFNGEERRTTGVEVGGYLCNQNSETRAGNVRTDRDEAQHCHESDATFNEEVGRQVPIPPSCLQETAVNAEHHPKPRPGQHRHHAK